MSSSQVTTWFPKTSIHPFSVKPLIYIGSQGAWSQSQYTQGIRRGTPGRGVTHYWAQSHKNPLNISRTSDYIEMPMSLLYNTCLRTGGWNHSAWRKPLKKESTCKLHIYRVEAVFKPPEVQSNMLTSRPPCPLISCKMFFIKAVMTV